MADTPRYIQAKQLRQALDTTLLKEPLPNVNWELVAERVNEACKGLPENLEEECTAGTGQSITNDFCASQLTYGETTDAEFVSRLLLLKSDDVFYDLGSGRGQVVLQIAEAGLAQKAAGIELVQRRHRIAQLTNKQLGSPAEFTCGDILTHDASDATKVYMTNSTFEEKMNIAIATRFADITAFPNLQMVATTNRLPLGIANVTNLFLQRVSAVPVNWGIERAPLFVYKRCETDTPAPMHEVDESAEEMLDAMNKVGCNLTGAAQLNAFMTAALFHSMVHAVDVK
ncbi:hypothetical protein CYMTET_28451 [Cymbomonas tetramitiformis]|uniref:Histone-lysine N-methyltransferase, H3 lysine-79 specific n=1 Tax=Cymbomonas tetramitiformis TaxID=36881 RepID=A0AAE0FN24_9CHLO|nr:hypothetical protein CYMTET_28451 [Cymbomonas tetramitiformis]|eukprot:gene24295-29512_t